MSFSRHPLVARDLEPAVTLRIGPGVEDVILLSVARIEERKGEIVAALRSVPGLSEGASWLAVRPYVAFDNTDAKVAISLGHHLGLWKMHPPPGAPEMWLDDSCPMVLAGTVKAPEGYVLNSGTPKPSRGDLEVHLKACESCRRPMGPWNSQVHALLAAEPDSSQCIECVLGFGPGA